MNTYPVITYIPSTPFEVADEDNVQKSDRASGTVHRRAKFTRIRKTFTLNYDVLPLYDLSRLLAFYNSVYGIGPFYFSSFSESYNPDIFWKVSTLYQVGDICRPTSVTGRSYICTVAGTSGTVQPTWDTTYNTTQTDNTVTWRENTYIVNFGSPIKRTQNTFNSFNVTVTLEQI